jgi:hypothetical protein
LTAAEMVDTRDHWRFLYTQKTLAGRSDRIRHD